MSKNFFLLFLILISVQIAFAQKADAILGNWKSEKGDKIINIYKTNDLYYGKVTWIADSAEGKGKDRQDIKNPNAALKTRKVVGVDFLLSFSYFSERDVWKEGKIYNYETGNNYSGKIHLSKEDQLELTGYYGILWFLGRTQIWTRTK